MSGSKPAQPGKFVLIASLCALGACETLSAAGQTATPAPAAAAIDEATGAGTFYPAVSSVERPEIRFARIAGVGPRERQFFTDQVNLAATSPGRTFPIVAQAVGANRETLVLLYFGGEGPMTPYLARGILARLTSITRFNPAIAEMGVSSEFDIYNAAAALGFAQIVVTDGRAFAHQAELRAD